MKCPECKSSEIAPSHTETYCRSCGTVLDDEKAEQGQSGRLSGTLLKDGRIVKAAWLYSNREKSLFKATTFVSELAWRDSLPKYCVEQCLSLYKTAAERDLLKGRSSETILLALLYFVCLQNNIPITVLDLTLNRKLANKVLRSYNLLRKSLGLVHIEINPIDLLPRYCSRLGLSNEVLMKAILILKKIKGVRMYSGKNPKTLAAAAIYISVVREGCKISQRDIANATGVLECTIRRRSLEIVDATRLK